MRIVFIGSGVFAIPSFEALVDAGHQVAALVTQPDKEKGRGRAMAPPPLKPVALARAVPILQPRRIREPEIQAQLRELAPDLQVVVAYGQILPRPVIEVAPLGTVNVHASLLPRYRGAAPIQWALVNGETETGVTTMLIDEGLDTGPVLLSRTTPIGDGETAPELETRLAQMGAAILLETITGLANGSVRPTSQDHSRATLAPLIRKEDGHIDWRWPAGTILGRMRGFTPWPGIFATLGGHVVRVVTAHAVAGVHGAAGEVTRVDREGVTVACGEGTALQLREVRPESRRTMAAADFARGARILPGARFE